MKKNIKRKLYDTNSAKLIGEWNNKLPVDDLQYNKEVLYRKQTGEYFLYTYGGPLSSNGKWDGENGEFNETIIPISYERAKKWAEEHLSNDVYVQHFTLSENGSVKIAVNIPCSLKRELENEAEEKNMVFSELVRMKLAKAEEYLSNNLYIKPFTLSEDGKVRIVVNIPCSLKRSLADEAREKNMIFSELVRMKLAN